MSSLLLDAKNGKKFTIFENIFLEGLNSGVVCKELSLKLRKFSRQAGVNLCKTKVNSLE